MPKRIVKKISPTSASKWLVVKVQCQISPIFNKITTKMAGNPSRNLLGIAMLCLFQVAREKKKAPAPLGNFVHERKRNEAEPSIHLYLGFRTPLIHTEASALTNTEVG